MRAAAFAIVLAACGAAPPAHDADGRGPLDQQHHATKFRTPGDGLQHAAVVRYHMARSLDDLRGLQRAIVFGDLDAARALAALVGRPARDPGFAAWSDAVAQVTSAARALADAASTDRACRRAAALAGACRECHVRAGATRAFPIVAEPAPSMARHGWALDRLLDGLVGDDDRSWRAGLAALGEPALPSREPLLAARLEELARDARADTTPRERVYERVLAACAGCHARTRGTSDAIAVGEVQR